MAVTPVSNKTNFNFAYADTVLCPAKIILANFLQEISTATLKSPLIDMDLERLADAYERETLENLSDNEVLFRIHLLQEYPFPTARVGVEMICEHFEAKYPGVFDKYFDDQDDVINAQGAKLILDAISEKKNSSLPIYILSEDTLEDFANSDATSAGFILGLTCCTHYISLFLEKREDGKIDIVSTDSCGIWFVDSIMSDIPSSFPLGNFYACKQERQADGFHCSVFAIRDLAKWMDLYAQGISPVQMIEEKTPDLHTETLWDCEVNVFEYLPPEMMKVTQSMRQIKDYETLHGVSIHTHPFHHPFRDDGDMNCLIEHRYIKYSIGLIEKALKEKQILV